MDMHVDAMNPGTRRPAGHFAAWVESMKRVLRNEAEADVPCDGCTGCCISSYAIALRPSDAVALAQVPARHLRLPIDGGLAFMGYRDDGTCPMLEGNSCTIYRDRPRTCRDYDCRIYAATGLAPDGDRPVIQSRVAEWQFEYCSHDERGQHQAMVRAARFIQDHAALFPAALKAHVASAAAVLAFKAWEEFTQEKGDGSSDPSPDSLIRRVLEAVRRFDEA
jgi:Fe-S-cluster containining protein